MEVMRAQQSENGSEFCGMESGFGSEVLSASCADAGQHQRNNADCDGGYKVAAPLQKARPVSASQGLLGGEN